MQQLPPIKHITYINAPVQKVFETLTTSAGWDGWFTKGTVLDLENKHIKLVWRNWGPYNDNAEDGGEITNYKPDHEFAFNWYVTGHATNIIFKLEPQGKGTRLTVTETGHELTDNDAKQLVNCSTGWGEALTLLKFYLEHGIVYGAVPKM